MRLEQGPIHQPSITVQGHGGPSFIILMSISQPLKGCIFPRMQSGGDLILLSWKCIRLYSSSAWASTSCSGGGQRTPHLVKESARRGGEDCQDKKCSPGVLLKVEHVVWIFQQLLRWQPFLGRGTDVCLLFSMFIFTSL